MAWTNPDVQLPGTKITDDIWNDQLIRNLLMLATHTHTLNTPGDGQQKVRDRWFPATVPTDGAVMGRIGDYPVVGMSANTHDGFISFNCPTDFVSLVSLKAIFISGFTGTLTYGHSGSRAAIGEAYTAHVSAASGLTVGVTTNALFEIDIAARFPNLAAGDYCGYQFNNGVANITYLVGIAMRHVA